MIKCLLLLGLQLAMRKADPEPCGPHTVVSLNSTQRKEILYMHNGIREAIASGKYPGYGPAKNINQMYWDESLETLAIAFTEFCEYKHDPSRITQSPSGVLTFAARYDYEVDPQPRELIQVAEDDWKYTTPKIIDRYQGGSRGDTFAQMLWASTNRIGCGESKYKEYNPNKPNNTVYILSCYYTPGGLVRGEPIYLRGKPCSECTNGTKCGLDPEFPSLCGEENGPPVPTTNDTWGKSLASSKYGTASFRIAQFIMTASLSFQLL